MPPTFRALRRWLFAVGMTMLFLTTTIAVTTVPAQAHASVVSTDPEADAVLPTAPSAVTVVFSEAVSPVTAGTTVIAPDGSPATDGPVITDGDTMILPLADGLADGTYLVSYRVVSADGHPVPGGFMFSIGQPSAPPRTEDGAVAAEEADPMVTGLVVADRWLGYLGLLAVLGPGLLLMAGPAASRSGARRLVAIGLSTVAGTAVVGLYLQVPYTAGRPLFDITGADVGAVLAGRAAGAAMLRLLVVLVALPLVLRLRTGGPGRVTGKVLAVLGVALAATWPMSGHATTSPSPPLTVAADTIHITAAAVWLGGLMTLAGYLLRPGAARRGAVFLPVWSRWATWLVAAIAATGAAQAFVQIGSVSALVGTTYGWLVIAKVALFGVALAAAVPARSAVARHRFDDSDDGALVGRVRRSVLVELAVGAVVLALSAVLVQTVPADTAVGTPQQSMPQYVGRTFDTPLYRLRFDLEPARVGTNTVHLYLFDPTGRPLEPIEWYAAVGNPDEELAPIQYGLAELAPNHVSGEVVIPAAGNWEFTFRIRASKIEEKTVSTVIALE